MENKEILLIKNVSSQMELEEETNTFEAFRKKLIELVDHLLKHQYEKLLWILYRIDVNEKTLNRALEEKYEQQAAEVIADLIIEREVQKINKGDLSSTENWSFDI